MQIISAFCRRTWLKYETAISDSLQAMFTLALLTAALIVGSACSKPTPSQATGNFIMPGVLGDLIYKDDLTLDAYAPEGSPRPAVIIIHGSHGNKQTHVTQLFEPLSRAGFDWFSVDYRTSKDVEEAVRFIRCSGRFNITNRLFVIGEDTGGDIALELAARGGFQGVATFGVKFGASSTANPLGARTLSRRQWPSIPVHMFHGTDDDELPFAQAQAICKEMLNCVMHAVPGGIHQFEN